MPPRPVLKVKQNRPISAIYLGKDANSHTLQSTASLSSHTEATSPRLPDLPEPPSPSSRIGSARTGLPSPPGTNSNGSGSTGDPATVTSRERLSSHQTRKSNSMSSGNASTPMKRILNGGGVGYDDYDGENGNDNDNDNDSNDDTLRLNKNVMALQRVKSLSERNRTGPSKASKLSRMSAASPHRPSLSRSGSETEREINSPSSSSYHHPSPSLSPASLHDPSHQRRTSALPSASVSSPNSSPSRHRKRASMVRMLSLQLTDSEEEVDNDELKTTSGAAITRTRARRLSEQDLITQSALAAVASSRSPLSSRWRAGLPKEFRSDIVDDSPSPTSPSKGRISVADAQKESVKPDIRDLVTYLSIQRPVDPVTPFRRPSTIREYRRRDFGSPSTDRQYNITNSNKDGNQRRQTLRGGSAESALISPGGRSLIREGLKAAGLSKKRQEDRRVEWSPEVNKKSMSPEKERLHPPRVATSMAEYRKVDNEDDDPDRRYRVADRPAHRLHSRDREGSLARAEISITGRERERDSIPMDRAGSSFARYNHNNYPHSPSPAPLLSTPRRTFERLSTPSPFGIRRLNAQSPAVGSSSNQTEHIKLMLESLTVLETQLNKLPLGKFVGGSSTGTNVAVGSTGASQTELAKDTQSMVYAAERLSELLKKGNGRAVEEQVEAEVEESSTGLDTQEIRNIWSRVAADYRENSRVADELVRGITGFLLGIGRVMRDIGPSSLADYEGVSPHGNHVTLDADEEELRLRRRRESPSPAGSARRSVSSRSSRDGMVVSSDSGSPGAGAQRPESVLARASTATHQKRPGDRELQFETPPSPSHQQRHIRQASIRKLLPALPDRSESARRLFTPREQREQILDAKFSSHRPVDGSDSESCMPTRDSQETFQLRHDLSPTPASRTRDGNTQDREGILSPLKFPKPLPTLPSETLVRRLTVNKHVERIASPSPAATTGRSTIKSSLPASPSLTAPKNNATTALTPHTVSISSPHSNNSVHINSSESGSASPFPLQRSDSNRSNYTRVSLRASALR